MLVRFFEYDTQIALDEGQISGNILTVTLPHSAVLFLRHHASTPDTLKIRMVTPGGTVEYDIQVMKSQQYTLKAIFEKNLLLLIPFYIFSHESQFEEYEKDKTKLKSLQEEYEQIKNKLEELLKAVMGGKVLEYEAKTIKREGIEQGIEQGENKLSMLIATLMENGRSQDIIRVTQDKEYRNKLYQEYLINQ